MPKLFDKKTEELIALGAAYAINCVKCMKVHKKVAVDAGVSAEEMNQALCVAEGIVTGARGVTRNETKNIFGNDTADTTHCSESSGCCP